ncbi:max-like protein X [Hypanus sabinus]|uniref:max-like protein X n=1 Tax=Hypanus sabinus TaxID=79690 RepID=UPI0028C3C5D9|nr:max-like protein X [Hypanus sabinus]
MAEPSGPSEDPWVKVRRGEGDGGEGPKSESSFSDSAFESVLLTESSRKGSIGSRANSITSNTGSTSASSVPNTAFQASEYIYYQST